VCDPQYFTFVLIYDGIFKCIYPVIESAYGINIVELDFTFYLILMITMTTEKLCQLLSL